MNVLFYNIYGSNLNTFSFTVYPCESFSVNSA